MNYDIALGLVRLLLDQGFSKQDALSNPAIPAEFRSDLEAQIDREENVAIDRPLLFSANGREGEWLQVADRSQWYYWPILRLQLLSRRGWTQAATRSLDEATNRILAQLASPSADHFDIRGLVIGYVQSGKTANYSALIAKAADVGYKLIVVLSGIDNGLRRQTQIRLQSELVGSASGSQNSVPLPPPGRQWHLFTSDLLQGDFRPGFANQAALQGAQPVLLVVKKNGAVLRKLLRWLREAPANVHQTLPFLLVDDEADQASIDTRGDYITEDEELPEDYEEPSPINTLIRALLATFQRSAYVAYTATPFANILIPNDSFHPEVLNDLYPKDFIIDLPKPTGYFGAEELFGLGDGEASRGLDIFENVSDEDIAALDDNQAPAVLRQALEDFVLAGAARAMRGKPDHPATMLIHVSQLRSEHHAVGALVQEIFNDIRDQWRYQRSLGIQERLRERWESFRSITRSLHPEFERPIEDLVQHIGPFLEAVQVKTLNMDTGDVLDYEREPRLKAIAIGGNKLSRGLTLEGLLVSFFVRRTEMYDTLMQMGRWFGFRAGYEDLTRIYTTSDLRDCFADLASVEFRLREDLSVYEQQGLTPSEIGMRIWQHPTMQVTSRLKRRFANETLISQSYSGSCEQTFKFPFSRPDDLTLIAERNRLQVIDLISKLGPPNADRSASEKLPVWTGVNPRTIIEFLRNFSFDSSVRSLSPELICAYIAKSLGFGELNRWCIAIQRRLTPDAQLGIADWGVSGWVIDQIGRTRIADTNSIGVLTSPGDEAAGLDLDTTAEVDRLVREAKEANIKKSKNRIARECRPPGEGLLLLYPISRNSGAGTDQRTSRQRLFDPEFAGARDLVGLAVSFPLSNQDHPVEAYMQGTVGWRVID